MKGDRLSTLVSFEAMKLAAGMVLLSPNIPLLFMGEEYEEEAPFQYFVSHSNPELIEAVRKGRKEEFAAFQREGELPDPQNEATFLNSKVALSQRADGNHKILFDFYKTLIKLRKEIPPLSHSSNRGMKIRALGKQQAIVMRREYGSDRVISIFNFDSQPVNIRTSLGKGGWQRAFDSSSSEWGGSGSRAPESIPSGRSEVFLQLNPYSFVLYRSVNPMEQE
jgi:maltooligosyltrehalose trehalohydrolase